MNTTAFENSLNEKIIPNNTPFSVNVTINDKIWSGRIEIAQDFLSKELGYSKKDDIPIEELKKLRNNTTKILTRSLCILLLRDKYGITS